MPDPSSEQRAAARERAKARRKWQGAIAARLRNEDGIRRVRDIPEEEWQAAEAASGQDVNAEAVNAPA